MPERITFRSINLGTEVSGLSRTKKLEAPAGQKIRAWARGERTREGEGGGRPDGELERTVNL